MIFCWPLPCSRWSSPEPQGGNWKHLFHHTSRVVCTNYTQWSYISLHLDSCKYLYHLSSSLPSLLSPTPSSLPLPPLSPPSSLLSPLPPLSPSLLSLPPSSLPSLLPPLSPPSSLPSLLSPHHPKLLKGEWMFVCNRCKHLHGKEVIGYNKLSEMKIMIHAFILLYKGKTSLVQQLSPYIQMHSES